MDNNKNRLPKTVAKPATHQQQTLRRPVQIVKKHSGQLDEVLAELNKADAAIPSPGTNSAVQKDSTNQLTTRRRSTLKDKEKKRERWLLTRKTWRYMTDAGRKLIPDGVQNRQEDIPKIEAHFQKICAIEPHFILWRRKYSYPGAMRNSKKRLKQLLQHAGQKSLQILEKEEINNADIVLELLYSYLKLDDAIKTDTLLGTKTEGPHQTNSPSAQRPKSLTRGIRKREGMNFSLRGPGFLPPCATAHLQQQQNDTDQLLQRLLTLSRSSTMTDIINIPPPEQINSTLLNDKPALKKIYIALKKQQLHRILSKHSIPSKLCTNLRHSTCMLSLSYFNSSHPNTTTETTSITNTSTSYKIRSPTDITTSSTTTSLQNTDPSSYNPPTASDGQRQRKPPTSLNISGYSNSSSIPVKKTEHYIRHTIPAKQFNSCGTQTNFIPLSEIKSLAEEYKDFKREDLTNEFSREGGNATTDDEAPDKQITLNLSRRKSSIDNEDVSQSVSDTIKRYLRMVRKKSVHDDNANRFKRVNYDRNLRNIQAKGEINLPGMDDNLNKAVQTLDAWALIAFDFLRGDVNSGVLETAHKDWQKSLDERLRRKLEYEQKIILQTSPSQLAGVNQSTSSCSSSTPTSPMSNLSQTMANIISVSPSSSMNGARTAIDPNTGAATRYSIGENSSHVSSILQSGSQFIANLWHGNISSSNLSSPTRNEPKQEHAIDDGGDATLNPF